MHLEEEVSERSEGKLFEEEVSMKRVSSENVMYEKREMRDRRKKGSARG